MCILMGGVGMGMFSLHPITCFLQVSLFLLLLLGVRPPFALPPLVPKGLQCAAGGVQHHLGVFCVPWGHLLQLHTHRHL